MLLRARYQVMEPSFGKGSPGIMGTDLIAETACVVDPTSGE